MLSFTKSRSMQQRLVFGILIFCSLTSLYPQQFHSLDGIESSTGQTLLIYRLGLDNFLYNPVYKFGVQSGYEEKIMDAHSGIGGKSISDYEFFPNDTANFMDVGEFGSNINFYIARNDMDVVNPPPVVYWVDISKQNPQKVFVFGNGGEVRSWDGGYTFPVDSIPAITNFIPIALADFDDNILFGINDEQQLAKNAVVVDTSMVSFGKYSKFLYDVNQFHVYRVNWTYGGYSLNVSNNKGDANTWTKTFQSENPIFITIDSTQSGVVYLADGRSIYKSVNNGYTFTHYKSLPSKLVGIYKKPNSDILYAASKYQLYEVRTDTTIILKSIPIPSSVLAYYPLEIGNKWVYSETLTNFDIGPSYSYNIKTREVLKDTILSNGKKYFKLYDNTTFISSQISFERIDSATGLVYRFNGESDISPEEYLIDDLLSEMGDTILSYRDNVPFTNSNYNICVETGLTYFFGKLKSKKSFMKFDLTGYSYNLIYEVGLDSIYHSWDFGNSLSKIKGCILNGIVYGDTTLTEVNEKPNAIPTEFKLEQNYPNPFNPSTKISWQSPVSSWQTLRVYNVLGREVATLVDEYRNAGSYEVEFNVAQVSRLELPSGVYFYRIRIGNFIETKKMILLK